VPARSRSPGVPHIADIAGHYLAGAAGVTARSSASISIHTSGDADTTPISSSNSRAIPKSARFTAAVPWKATRPGLPCCAGAVPLNKTPWARIASCADRQCAFRRPSHRRISAHPVRDRPARPDFFNAAKFPRIEYHGRGVRKSGDGWVVEGALTIRGTTRSVPWRFMFKGTAPAQQGKPGRVAFHGRPP